MVHCRFIHYGYLYNLTKIVLKEVLEDAKDCNDYEKHGVGLGEGEVKGNTLSEIITNLSGIKIFFKSIFTSIVSTLFI